MNKLWLLLPNIKNKRLHTSKNTRNVKEIQLKPQPTQQIPINKNRLCHLQNNLIFIKAIILTKIFI